MVEVNEGGKAESGEGEGGESTGGLVCSERVSVSVAGGGGSEGEGDVQPWLLDLIHSFFASSAWVEFDEK